MDLSDVITSAREAHGGQTRRFSGDPYVVHPIRVGDMIFEERNDQTLAAAGYLHDVLEDTDVGKDVIRNVANEEVLNIVKRLSHDLDYDHKDRAIAHSLEKHDDARLVKLYDRLDNVSHLAQAS